MTYAKLLSCVLALAPCVASATPLVMARYPGGVIVATNDLDTAGRSHCKLHFWTSGIVLRASEITVLMSGDRPIVDMNRELDNALSKKNVLPNELLPLIFTTTTKGISEELAHIPPNAPQLTLPKGQVGFQNIFLISTKKPGGGTTITLAAIGAVALKPARFEMHQRSGDMAPGILMDATRDTIRIVKFTPTRADAIAAVRKQLQENATITHNAPSFSPPFRLADVPDFGATTLVDPGGPCRVPKQ